MYIFGGGDIRDCPNGLFCTLVQSYALCVSNSRRLLVGSQFMHGIFFLFAIPTFHTEGGALRFGTLLSIQNFVIVGGTLDMSYSQEGYLPHCKTNTLSRLIYPPMNCPWIPNNKASSKTVEMMLPCLSLYCIVTSITKWYISKHLTRTHQRLIIHCWKYNYFMKCNLTLGSGYINEK